MRVSLATVDAQSLRIPQLTGRYSIVEYATREQAQNAVATLSNQNLMGRLIYVREVRYPISPSVDQNVAKVRIGS
jgi:hypothetical protein